MQDLTLADLRSLILLSHPTPLARQRSDMQYHMQVDRRPSADF